MKPEFFLVLVCTAFAVLVYLAFEVMVFRFACRLARVAEPSPARTIGLTFAILVAAFVAEGALAGVLMVAFTRGGFPLWEAELVGFFLGLPVHMVLASVLHAKVLGATIGEALSVWFVEKSMKLALAAVGAGGVGLILLVQRVGG
jgi:hypothetical protein